MKLKSLVLAIGALVISGGVHAAAPTDQKFVELKYEKAPAKRVQQTTTKPRTAPVSTPSYDCRVVVDAIVDARNNRQTLGANWAEPLLPSGLEPWLEQVRALELANKTGAWAGGKQVQVKPRLTRLYSYVESMNIHGVIALDIEYWVDQTLVETKKYRGLGSKTNMWNALSEYGTALNYAVHDMAPDVLTDIKAICGTKS